MSLMKLLRDALPPGRLIVFVLSMLASIELMESISSFREKIIFTFLYVGVFTVSVFVIENILNFPLKSKAKATEE